MLEAFRPGLWFVTAVALAGAALTLVPLLLARRR